MCLSMAVFPVLKVKAIKFFIEAPDPIFFVKKVLAIPLFFIEPGG